LRPADDSAFRNRRATTPGWSPMFRATGLALIASRAATSDGPQLIECRQRAQDHDDA
jgi:hypothetical protein